jgi:hypothetical protein
MKAWMLKHISQEKWLGLIGFTAKSHALRFNTKAEAGAYAADRKLDAICAAEEVSTDQADPGTAGLVEIFGVRHG